jgi:integrase
VVEKLTIKSVEGAQPGEKPYEIRDSELRGFLLRVQPTGVKVFYAELRRGTRERLGAYPVTTVAAGRERARKALGKFDYTGEHVPRRASMTFGEFMERRYAPWVTAERKAGRQTAALIEAHFGDLYRKPLDKIAGWDVEKIKSERLKAGLNPATVNRDLARIRAALSKALEWDLIAAHPLGKVKRAKGGDDGRIRFLSVGEEKALRKALDDREARFRTRRDSGSAWRRERGREPLPAIVGYYDHLLPMTLVALNTGLRRGELTAIAWADVNLVAKLLTIRAGYAKSGKARHIPLNAEALEILKRYRRQHSGDGRLFAVDSVKKAWNALVEAAGLADFRFHDLRHTFASKLVMAGVDLNTVRELLGHADIRMTLRYAHLAPEHKAAAVERLVAR